MESLVDEILIHLSLVSKKLRDLIHLSLVSKKFNSFCRDDNFFKTLYFRYYTKISKTSGITYREHIIKIYSLQIVTTEDKIDEFIRKLRAINGDHYKIVQGVRFNITEHLKRHNCILINNSYRKFGDYLLNEDNFLRICVG